jgi:hypothetical protein
LRHVIGVKRGPAIVVGIAQALASETVHKPRPLGECRMITATISSVPPAAFSSALSTCPSRVLGMMPDK